MTGTDPTRQWRRRTQERQAVVFGVLFATLAIIGLVGAAVYTETIRLPFLSRPFSTPAPAAESLVPCPSDGALPVLPQEITVNVRNTTTLTGLAGQTAENLHVAYGFVIGTTDNYKMTIAVPQIVFGPEAVVQAYTLRGYLQNAQLVFDPERPGTAVDLMVNPDGVELAETVGLEPDVPLAGAVGCVPLADLVP
ncbi:MAG: LytR C-terminal domain-containing protein [Micrococcales bacterium]|nr:LytR C-terminal domain-containing protein [Micrococcales bacterium]